MRNPTSILALLAAAMIVAAPDAPAKEPGRGAAHPGNAAQVERGRGDMDRDRMQDRDRLHAPAPDRGGPQDRVHAPGQAPLADEDIYGHQLMSVEERNQYRERMTLIGSDPEQRSRFMAEHREHMQARARAQGVTLDDVPGPKVDEE